MTRILQKRTTTIPILPTAAVLSYLLVGVEYVLLLFVRSASQAQQIPVQNNWHLTFWRDDYLFSWSLPELMIYLNLLVVVLLWLGWRGVRVAQGQRLRAILAFLCPALVLALVSWQLLGRAPEDPLKGVTVHQIGVPFNP